MQNHPHDSICGCSCDEVHREMDTSFEKCQILGEQLADEVLQHIANQITVGRNAVSSNVSSNIVVFNPVNIHRRELVIATVDFPKDSDISNLIV